MLTFTQAATSQMANKSTFLAPSLDGSGKEATPEMVAASGAKQFKSRYVPSARHSNWMENPTQCTEPKDATG
jgi:hypothetical protein